MPGLATRLKSPGRPVGGPRTAPQGGTWRVVHHSCRTTKGEAMRTPKNNAEWHRKLDETNGYWQRDTFLHVSTDEAHEPQARWSVNHSRARLGAGPVNYKQRSTSRTVAKGACVVDVSGLVTLDKLAALLSSALSEFLDSIVEFRRVDEEELFGDVELDESPDELARDDR